MGSLDNHETSWFSYELGVAPAQQWQIKVYRDSLLKM